MHRIDPSRRVALTRLLQASVGLYALPWCLGCGSGGETDLSDAFDVPDLNGANIEVVLRGFFVPQIDLITERLAERWQQSRNATISLVLSPEWRAVSARAAQQGRGPDVGLVTASHPHIYGERFLDLTELAEPIGEALGGWTEVAQAACVVNGVWRAVPWSTTRHGLVVRSDLIDAVGAAPPDSYLDLLDVAKRLSDRGLPPVGLSMSELGPADASALAYPMLWAFGGQEVGENGRVALHSDATLRALEYFEELSTFTLEAALDFEHPDNNDGYMNGEISITQNPSSIYLRALGEAPTLAENTVHLPMPVGEAGRFQLPEIDSLAVFEHSPDPVAAKDWISFVTARPVLLERARESAAFHAPAVHGLDDHPDLPWNSDAALAGLRTSAAEGRLPGWPLPPSIEAGLVYENASIVNMFNAVGRGDLTPAAARDRATEELRRVYET